MRTLVSLCCLLVISASLLAAPPSAAQTGQAIPEMAHYDAFFASFLAQYGIPGASVAVSKNGRLVYARGFGQADVAASDPVEPTSRARIASISKPVTAIAVMTLVEDGLLGLDDAAFALLDDLPPRDGYADAAGLAQITVRDLLQHSGGWDRDATGYDPMFQNAAIAAAMGVARPAPVEATIRYMRSRPLDFAPGARYAYSNFGYAVLGRIIERVTGQSYAAYVQGVFAEAGVETMELGRSLAGEALPGEVSYYPQNEFTSSVYGGVNPVWWTIFQLSPNPRLHAQTPPGLPA